MHQKPAHARRPLPACDLQAALNRNPHVAELTAAVQTLVDVQTALQSQWPGLRLQVLSVRQGVLTVSLPSAALAAKARQSEPSIVATVRRLHPLVQSVRFRPVRTRSTDRQPTVSGRDRSVSPEALEHLQMTASHLEKGPLRAALNRLIRRQLSEQ